MPSVVAARSGQPRAIWLTMAHFTAMEALQALGYAVVDRCGTPANQVITLLSYLHIVFQPFFINAFAMQLVPETVRENLCRRVYLCCALSSAIMLAQLVPSDWLGTCLPGTAVCGEKLCLTSGNWHIAWHIPYNGLLVPIKNLIGIHAGFPTYILVAFVLPLAYGAWRFVVLHAVVGPIAAHLLTNNPNEVPAVWCLFSLGILLLALSPFVRKRFETTEWWAWPKSWQI